MAKHQCRIALLQETRFHPLHNPPPHVQNHRLFYEHHEFTHRDARRGGVAILVHNSIVCSPLEISTSPLCSTWIQIYLESGKKLTLGNVYAPPDEAALVQHLAVAMSDLSPLSLIAGDFNAKGFWDAYSAQNVAGTQLTAILDEFPLVLLNGPQATNITSYTKDGHTRTSRSVIDLAFSTPKLFSRTMWEQIPDFPRAAHRPAIITISDQPLRNEATPPPPRYRLRLADEKSLNSACEAMFSQVRPVFARHSMAVKLKVLQTVFHIIGILEIGLTTPRENSKPGWTRKATQLKHSRDKARRFVNDQPQSKARRRRLKNAQKRFDEERHRSLEASGVNLVREACEQRDPWPTFNRYLGKNAFQPVPPLDNDTAITPQQQALAFLDRFQGTSTRKPASQWDAQFTAEVDQYFTQHAADFRSVDSSADYNTPFAMHELDRILDNLKDSASGADNLPPWFYRNSSPAARDCVLMLHNESFETGVVLEAHKEADIVSIPKPHRDHTKSSEYRPISLILINARVSESLIQKRLYHWSETNRHIPDSQFAFRHHSNFTYPLVLITQAVQAGFVRNEQTVLVRLDLKRAFDTADPQLVLYKLHKLGLRGRLLKWIGSFMENRRYRVVRPATTEYVDFDIGVPQGSGLSPLLFTLLTSDISHLLKCDHVEFADDITLHYTHWDPQTIVDMLNGDL